MMFINSIAVTVIVLWAFWCWLSPDIHDGLIGKILCLLLMLAALGVLSNPGQDAEVLLNLSVAALAIRHWWMKTYYPRVRDFVLSHLRCKNCPNKPE